MDESGMLAVKSDVSAFLQSVPPALKEGFTQVSMSPEFWATLQEHRPGLTDPVSRASEGHVGYLLSLQVYLLPDTQAPIFA